MYRTWDLLSYFQFQTDLFPYFRKITDIYISHNVEKLVDQKWSISVVKGLNATLF